VRGVQVRSERSGVAFSVDPTAAGDQHLVVEGVVGQCEGLVSGELTPHHLVVDWGRYLWHQTHGAFASAGESDAAPLPPDCIVTQRTAEQARKYECKAGGELEVVATTAAERAHPPLTQPGSPLIHRVIRAVLQVATSKHRPQDIEWCWAGGQLYLVQTRPVTKFSFRRSLGSWHRVLGTSSSSMDESLVGDGFRAFTFNNFPPVPPSFSMAQVGGLRRSHRAGP
jgi:phosphoenolpyruvate synthase/pyruvate phosphate dikinase